MTSMRGEKIYDVELDITGITDYGVSVDAILADEGAIPLHGVGVSEAGKKTRWMAT